MFGATTDIPNTIIRDRIRPGRQCVGFSDLFADVLASRNGLVYRVKDFYDVGGIATWPDRPKEDRIHC